jgi:hypothetical protein
MEMHGVEGNRKAWSRKEVAYKKNVEWTRGREGQKAYVYIKRKKTQTKEKV